MSKEKNASVLALAGFLSGPAMAAEVPEGATPLTEISDNDLHDDIIQVMGPLRYYEDIIVRSEDAMPVAKHDTPNDKLVYFNVKTADENDIVCLAVDHLYPISEGVWRLDPSAARLTSPKDECISMLDEVGQEYEPVMDTLEPVVMPSKIDSRPRWQDGIDIGFLLGPYVEEYDMYTRGMNPDFRFVGLVPVGHSPWKLGATTNFYVPVGEMERSGLGRIGGVLGREFTLPKSETEVLISLQGGWSRDYNPLLNAPYLGVGGTAELARFETIHTSLVADVLISHDFIGNGWFLTGDPGVAYTGSLGFVMQPGAFIDEKEQKPKVEDIEPTVDLIKVMDRSAAYTRQAFAGVPDFDYPIHLTLSDSSNLYVAEVIRLKGEIGDLLDSTNYVGAHRKVIEVLKLAKKHNIELDGDLYNYVYITSRNVGEPELTYISIQKLVELGYPESDNWLRSFESSYAWVKLQGADLEYAFPFAPDQRTLLEIVDEELNQSGEYIGLIPVQELTLDGMSFTPTRISDGDQVTVVQP